MCEVLTKNLFNLKDPCMPLCMEYYIVQMSAAASYGGTDPSGSIFNDSAAQIRLNLSNSLGYRYFKGIGRLRLIGIDLRL